MTITLFFSFHCQRLLEFLEKVVQYSEMNKMSLDNVAMVIAPNLFYNMPRMRDSAMDELTLANRSSHLVKLLIRYHRLLWTVSDIHSCVFAHTCKVTLAHVCMVVPL